MARALRLEYEGACYHVMNRGDRREKIFLDDEDRRRFLNTLQEACERFDWKVFAYCLMGNHFHLVLETPGANLVSGMKWLLGTYTIRFNTRHKMRGHLFAGRYKSLLIDESSPEYLRTVCDYVHLNPSRARLLTKEEKLKVYPWSSYPAYTGHPKKRPAWLRTERLFGEHRIQKDDVRGRNEFARRTETARAESEHELCKHIRRGWKLGAEDFLERVIEKMGEKLNPGVHHREHERRETDQELASRLLQKELRRAKWEIEKLTQTPKNHPVKIKIARELRRQTPMTYAWIAEHLHMGTWRYAHDLIKWKY